MPSLGGMAPPIPVRAPRVRMRWDGLGFLHWRCPPDGLAGHLPPGVALDLRGEAWVSAVAFTMRRIRVVGLPVWPEVPELNLRTYAVQSGRPGIVFLAIDAPRAAAVLGRTQAVPYRASRIGVAPDGVESQPANGPRFAAQWRLGQAVDGALDRFLTERYCAWTARRGHLARADVEHAPFPLQAATATVTAWGSLPRPLQGRQPDLAHWSPGVAVACGPVRRVKPSPAPPQA